MELLGQTLWGLLTNPNVIYLLLISGLWMILIAVTMPGTGLPEASALILLGLAAVGLTQLPINLAGLLLILLAGVLYLVELQITNHGAFFITGTLALGIGSLLLFPAEEQTTTTPLAWWLVVLVMLASASFLAVLLRVGLAAQRRPALQDLKQLIGSHGVARTDVNGEGAVYVGGELWSAKADAKILANSEIVVVERNGLCLKVAPTPNKRAA